MPYQPPISSWVTTIFDVVYLADGYYTVIVKPENVNEPGAAEKVKAAGDYIKDFVGNSYLIIVVDIESNPDYVEGRVVIYDELDWGVGPQSGQPAIVYRSVQDGQAPYIAPSNNDRLDDSSLQNTRSYELDIAWKHRGFREETNNTDNITSVELGSNMVSSVVAGAGWRGGSKLLLDSPSSYDYWKLTQDTPFYVSNYGHLYNWYAITDPRNIASEGWRAPSNSDFETLLTYLGANSGQKLRESGNTHWLSPNSGTNEVGFNLRGSGERSSSAGGDYWLTAYSHIYTTDDLPKYFTVGFNYTDAGLGLALNKTNGASVRLIKESTSLTHGQIGSYTGNDGHVYPTICIGPQEWVSENIFETKYRTGELIPVVIDYTSWAVLTTGARASYLNTESNSFTIYISEGINVHDKDWVKFTDTSSVTWGITEISSTEIEVKANATAGIGGSGTPGYLPKWLTGGVTLGDSPAYTDGINVGFGATTGMTHKVEIVSSSHFPLQVKGSYGGGLVFGDETQFTFPYGGGIWAVGLTPNNSNYSFATSPGGITNLNIPSGGVSINFQVGGVEKFGMFGSGGVYVGSGYSGSDPGAGKLVVENMVGAGVSSVSARFHAAANASLTGIPSMRIDPGVLLTTPYSGNIENDGTHIYWTAASGIRYPLDTTGSGGSMVYPSGSGIPIVVTGSSWGATLTASGNSLKYVRVKSDESGFELFSAVYSISTSGAITGGTITGTGTIGHSTADGYRHIPTGGSSNAGKFLMATAVDGVYTWDDPATGGGGTVTSIAAGVGMSFTTITVSGSIVMGTPSPVTSTSSDLASTGTHTHSLNATGVTPATYTNATITVDSKGRITSAASGGAPGGGMVYPSTGLVVSTGTAWETSLSPVDNSLKEVRVKLDESTFELFTPLWKREENSGTYILSPFTNNDVVDVWSNSLNPTIGGNNTSGTGTNSDGGVGVYGYSSNGVGVFGYSTYNLGGAFSVIRGTSNTTIDLIELSRGLASGDLAAGLGGSLLYRLQSNREGSLAYTATGRFSNLFTDITLNHESAEFQWSLIDDGSVGVKMELFGSGKLKLNKYGTVTPFSGTAAKFLAVDSSGYVIEESIPTGSMPGEGIPLSTGTTWDTSFAASAGTANMSIRVDSEGAMWEWFTPAAGMALTDLSAVSPILYDNSTGVFTHSTGAGHLHVPATGTISNGKVLMCTAPIEGSFEWIAVPGISYPGAGIAISTGSEWGTSILIVSGNIVADAYTITANNFTLSSDRRRKSEVKNIDLKGVEIQYKEYEMTSSPGEKRYGVIAQDLLSSNPELVAGDYLDGYSVKYIDLIIKEVAYLKNEILKLKSN